MAELLGTVVGVVSLGLQVCSGLNTYLDGVQGHREETESTRRHCNYMEALVKQIEDAQQHNSASFSGSGSPSLQPVLTGAQTELSSLRDYLNKVCAEASTPQTTIAQKIEGQKRKLLYPFRRDHLNRLGERLATANTALQTALDLVQMYHHPPPFPPPSLFCQNFPLISSLTFDTKASFLSKPVEILRGWTPPWAP